MLIRTCSDSQSGSGLMRWILSILLTQLMILRLIWIISARSRSLRVWQNFSRRPNAFLYCFFWIILPVSRWMKSQPPASSIFILSSSLEAMLLELIELDSFFGVFIKKMKQKPNSTLLSIYKLQECFLNHPPDASSLAKQLRSIDSSAPFAEFIENIRADGKHDRKFRSTKKQLLVLFLLLSDDTVSQKSEQLGFEAAGTILHSQHIFYEKVEEFRVLRLCFLFLESRLHLRKNQIDHFEYILENMIDMLDSISLKYHHLRLRIYFGYIITRNLVKRNKDYLMNKFQQLFERIKSFSIKYFATRYSYDSNVMVQDLNYLLIFWSQLLTKFKERKRVDEALQTINSMFALLAECEKYSIYAKVVHNWRAKLAQIQSSIEKDLGQQLRQTTIESIQSEQASNTDKYYNKLLSRVLDTSESGSVQRSSQTMKQFKIKSIYSSHRQKMKTEHAEADVGSTVCASSVKKQSVSSLAQFESSNRILMLQIENQQINKMVSKGYFKQGIKQTEIRKIVRYSNPKKEEAYIRQESKPQDKSLKYSDLEQSVNESQNTFAEQKLNDLSGLSFAHKTASLQLQRDHDAPVKRSISAGGHSRQAQLADANPDGQNVIGRRQGVKANDLHNINRVVAEYSKQNQAKIWFIDKGERSPLRSPANLRANSSYAESSPDNVQPSQYLPQFKTILLYKSQLSLWNVNFVASRSSNKIQIYESNSWKLVFTFKVRQLSLDDNFNVTYWPQMTDMLLNYLKERQFDGILQLHNQAENRKVEYRRSPVVEYKKVRQPRNNLDLAEMNQFNIVFEQVLKHYLLEEHKMNGKVLSLALYENQYFMLQYCTVKNKLTILNRKLRNELGTSLANSDAHVAKIAHQIQSMQLKELNHINQVLSYRLRSGLLLHRQVLPVQQLLPNDDLNDQLKSAKLILTSTLHADSPSLLRLSANHTRITLPQDQLRITFHVSLLTLHRGFSSLKPSPKSKVRHQSFISDIHKNGFSISPLPVKLNQLRTMLHGVSPCLDRHNQAFNPTAFLFSLFHQHPTPPAFLHLLAHFTQNMLQINLEKRELQVKFSAFKQLDSKILQSIGMPILKETQSHRKHFAITQLENYLTHQTTKQEQVVKPFNPDALFESHFHNLYDDDPMQHKQTYQLSNIVRKLEKDKRSKEENHVELTHKSKLKILQDFPFQEIVQEDSGEQKIVQPLNTTPKETSVAYFRSKLANQCFEVKAWIDEAGLSLMVSCGQQRRAYKMVVASEFEDAVSKLKQMRGEFSNEKIKMRSMLVIRKMLSKHYQNRDAFLSNRMFNGIMNVNERGQQMLSETPSYKWIKYYLINRPNKLKRIFLFKELTTLVRVRRRKMQAKVILFYSWDKCRQRESRLSEERAYECDGEHLFMSLEVYSVSGRFEMSKVILNKYDLVKYLELDIGAFSQAKCFTDADVLRLARDVLQLTLFGKFAFSRIPYFKSPLLHCAEHANFSQDSLSVTPSLRRITNQSLSADVFNNKEYHQRTFLESFIKHQRLIVNETHKMYIQYKANQDLSCMSFTPVPCSQVEFCVVSVYRQLILNHWTLVVYVPKTSRKMIAQITLDDIRKARFNKLPVLDLLRFRDLEAKLTFAQFQGHCDSHKMQQLLQLRATSAVNINSENKVKTRFRTYVQSDRQNCFSIQDLIDEFDEFTNHLSTQLDRSAQLLDNDDDKPLRNQRFIELKIWQNMIFCMVLEKRNTVSVEVNLGKQYLPLQEYLNGYFMRMDRIGEAHVEFSITFQPRSKIRTQNQSKLVTLIRKTQAKFSNVVLEAAELKEQRKMQKILNVFQPFDNISYATSSNYNIQIQYYSFNQLEQVYETVNLRELLNLYIADGYFKYQTTYMNSKLNLCDIQNICVYVIYKITTQNFLNLTQYHLKPKSAAKSTLKKSILHKISDFNISIRSSKWMLLRMDNKLTLIKVLITSDDVRLKWQADSQLYNETITFDEMDNLIPNFKVILSHLQDQIYPRIQAILPKIVSSF